LNTLEHYAAWGDALMKAVEARVMPGTFPMDQAKIVRDQLQLVASKWNPDLKIYMAGSCVTLGVLEKDSDFDMCCLVQDLMYDRHKQAKMVEKFWSATRKNVPHHLRDHILGLAECRTPVLKLDCINEKELKHTQFNPLTPEDDKTARTGVIRLKTTKLSPTQIQELLKKIPGTVVSHNVGPFDPITGAGTTLAVEMSTTTEALQVLSALPDGQILPRSMREDLIRDFLDINVVPELLRFNWDCSFMGYSIKNSYLIRKYLLEAVPPYARYCSMAIKMWGKSNYVGVGSGGYLTTYAVSIMFLYFLLVTHNMKWIDPFKLPHPVYMPRYPDQCPLDPEKRPNPAEVGYVVAEFFRFYSNFNWETEVVSLNRPRRSTRDDLGWHEKEIKQPEAAPFCYYMCIEDPYEETKFGGLNLGRWLFLDKADIVKKELLHAAQQITQVHPAQADQVFFGKKRAPLGQTEWAPRAKGRWEVRN